MCGEGETIVPMREYSAEVYEEDEALSTCNMHIGQFPISFQYHCLLSDRQFIPAFYLFAQFLFVTHHTQLRGGSLVTNYEYSCNSPRLPFSDSI